jgi:hypothetical protein
MLNQGVESCGKTRCAGCGWMLLACSSAPVNERAHLQGDKSICVASSELA